MSVGPADPKSLQALPTWVVGSPIPPGVRIGKLLQGEYLIKGILGEGELGVTYEAENARLRRKFAVLMLKRELKPTQGMMLQVRDDLRHAEPLMNAGIMPVKMIVDHMMIPGFATELLEGETLRARLSRGPLPPPRALATVLAVAKAMDALHKAGAVHGDLRPENIFLVRPGAKSAFAGRVMVVEHALHALRRRSQGLDDQLPLYKLMYRPPECLAGESGPHVGGDVFVLGAILHECLTGRPAFYDEVADFVIDNLNQPPKPIAPNPAIGLTAELASTLSVLVASACARDPQMRTPDMAEIIVAIEQVVQGAGLTLPTVVTEEPQAAPPTPPTPTASRMNRLLNRLSGVFPQVPLPPVADTSKSSLGPAAGSAAGGLAPRTTAPPGSGSAPVPVAPQAITLPPLAAPRTKVTRLLQKLSGVFPVLQVSPDGNLETRQSSHPKLVPSGTSGPAPAQVANSASGPPEAKSEETPGEPPLATAAPIIGIAASASGRTEAAAPQSAQPTLVLGEQIGRPVTKPPLLNDQPTPQASQPQAPLPVAVPAEPRPALAEVTTQPLLADKPAADGAAARSKTAPPLAAAAASPTPAAAPSATSPAGEPQAPRPVAAEAAPPSSTASPVAGAGEPSQSVKGSEVAKALALLRQQQQARAAGVPVEPLRTGAGPATPGFVVPAFMAVPAPAAAAPSAPASGSAAVAAKSPEAPSASSPHPAAPPPAATPDAAQPPAGEPPAAALTPAGPHGAAPAAEAVTPAVSLPPSALSPTGERPPTAPVAPTIAYDSTLQPNDLADFIDAAKALVDSRQGPTTLSEIPTRPAAMAGLEPIPQHMEAQTQPALRRLPITEQATQAKLPTDLFALADSLKAPAREPAGTDPSPPVSGPAVASAPTVDTAPVALSAAGSAPASSPPPSAPPVPRDSIVELDPLNLGADLVPLTSAAADRPPPPPPPPPERPVRPRPPRVSQLIKALQQGQIDPLQAMQQASGGAREAVPVGPRATGSNPLATGGQPISPASATGSGPAQGRVSPGLMPMAPAPPKSQVPESPWGTGTQQVAPAPRPASAAPVSLKLRSFILRNQELVAAVFGALFVMLLGLAFLLLR